MTSANVGETVRVKTDRRPKGVYGHAEETFFP
jgi:hypothetical protein